MALTLAELVAHPRLGIEVLVEANLQREVRWVHATEQADPTPYLRGGEIVLTDGLWLDSPATADDYVRRLRGINVTAIGYGPMPETPEVPASLIDACAERGMCLFTMPPTLPFMAVTEVFVNRFAEDREAALAANAARNGRFLDAARSGVGVEGLLRLLQSEIDGPVWIVGPYGQVLYRDIYRPTEADCQAVLATIRRGAQHTPVVENGWQVQAIVARDVPRGYLIVGESTAAIGKTAEVVDQILPFFGMELAHAWALRQTQRRSTAELVDLVLAGEQQRVQVAARLAAANVGDDQPLAVVVCEADGDAEDAVDRVETALSQAGLRCLAAARHDQAVAFVLWDRPPEELPELGRLLRASVDVIVGISSLARGAGSLRARLIEARHACKIAAARHHGRGYDTYDTLGSYQLLLDLQPADVLRTFADAMLDPIRAHDRRYQSQLLLTVERFLDLDGRWQETADDLHVHVNTLRHRLTRVEQLIGRSLQSTPTRVDVYLALRASETTDL